MLSHFIKLGRLLSLLSVLRDICITLQIRSGQVIYGYEDCRQSRLLNLDVSGHLCGSASTLGDVRDEQVQRQLFHFHLVDTQAQKESA